MTAHTQQPRDADDGNNGPQDGDFEVAYKHSWAVLIGINGYTHHRKLQFATADAVAMARTLIERLRFPPGNVFLVVNDLASLSGDLADWLARIRSRLARVWEEGSKSIIGKLLITTLPDLVRPNDRVLVYFAGHGRNRSKPGAGRPKPFLIPEEAAHGEWDEYIDLDALAEHISEYNAKHVLCILDACCAGLLGVRADDRPRRYEQSLLQRKARQCITSGTAEERADDGGYQGHSLFTGYLLQALDQIDKSRARCPSGARARLLLSRTGNPSADRGRSRGSAGGIGPALHRARSPARTGQRATAAIPSGECPMTGGSAARSQRRNRW